MNRSLLLFLPMLFTGIPTLWGQGAVDLGTITYEGARPAVSVSVEAADPTTRALVTRAINLHGGLALAPDAEATFALSFAANPSGVELVIASGRPRQEQWRETLGGETPHRALLAALDRAVAKLLGLPGFFRVHMAFVSDRTGHSEIYLGDLLFAEVRQLTSDRSQSISPHLSPDGRFLLYTSYFRNGFPDLYRIDLATNQRQVFASFSGVNTGGVPDPSGNRVALVLSGTGNAELYTSNTRGTDLQRLTRTEALESDPSWSPDGARIVFSSDREGRPQLYQMSSRGGPMQRIPTRISGYCAEAAWNPRDPNLLAFTCAQAGEFEVAFYDFTRRESKVLTRGAGDAVEPVWLPDGRHLIYTRRTPQVRQLMLLDTQTGRAVTLSDPRFGNAWMADVRDPG